MRQQKTSASDICIIDERKGEDLLRQISALSKAYTPEWQFDSSDPDMGTVIALLFSEQMQENIRRLNAMPERYYAELINMLDISLKPAYPAHSIVLMDLVRDTVPGFKLPRGTKLLGKKDNGSNMVFETAYGIYITESKLCKAFMVSGSTGKTIPVFGRFPIPDYTEGAAQNLSRTFEVRTLQPFQLFDFRGEGYGKTGLLMYHTHLFDVQDNDIWMRIEGNDALAGQILEKQYQLFYYTQWGFAPVNDIRMANKNVLVFRKENECGKLSAEGGIYSALLLEPAREVTQNVTVSDIRFSSAGEATPPEYVVSQSAELEVSSFQPFGRNLSLFAEVFIGHAYFGKPEAVVTLDFSLEYESVAVMPPQSAKQSDLRIIKRKPYKPLEGTLADVYADEISLSYYNGAGWKKLKTFLPAEHLFQNGKEGCCKLQFICPKDWKQTETGGYAGYCIRMQLIRSDHCYYQPAVHHVPVMKNLTAAYTYENNYERPDRLISYQGVRRTDITKALGTNPNAPILFSSPYGSTSLYLGFDKRMECGPVSLMFWIEEAKEAVGNQIVFSYSTKNGFARLKLMDRTDGLSHTGTILFMPPPDWAKTMLEGGEAYWIRITDESRDLENDFERQPKVCGIALNAVDVDNIETLEEETYYIDNYEPHMGFSLNANNVLSVDVWVNETDHFSKAEIERLILEHPDSVKAEYNSMGEVSEFYVKWSETDNFDSSQPGDRHFVVDRMNSMLYFGDGVHVQIPKNTKGAAFRTIVRCCDGERANIGRSQVTEAFDDIMFVDKIDNPIQAFGGMDMESAEEALRRGSAMINNRCRLISALDYEREALAFSRKIVQAKAIMGAKKDGSYDAAAMTLVVLMEDHQEGSFSFIGLRPRLKQYFSTRCELSVDCAKLDIVEPVFLEISVEAWIHALHADEGFEIGQELIRMLQNYLDPVKNDCWEIGHTASENQIALRLNMEKGNALIRRIMVTAKYKDETGRHETELKAFQNNPYVVVTSGEHKIHIEQ